MPLAYLARRVGFAIVLVFVVSSASLLLAHLAPGDFMADVFPLGSRPETVARARAQAGLDRPFAAQYRDWLGRAVRLDFGVSLLYGRPVGELLPERAANTAILAGTALVIATGLGIPLGALAGSRRRGWLPTAIHAVSIVALSLPPLLTSLLLVFLAARTGWLPIGGMRAAGASGLGDLLWHLIVPATALAVPMAATFERLQAQSMSEVMGQPYILAAAGRGVPLGRLVWRHALRVAIRPCAAVYGLAIGALLSGSFAVEMVTAWPGIGRLLYDALRARDVYLVAGCAAVGALFLALGTLVSDLATAAADPRVREGDG